MKQKGGRSAWIMTVTLRGDYEKKIIRRRPEGELAPMKDGAHYGGIRF